MINRILAIYLICLFSFSPIFGKSKPIVIAIAPFCDFSSCEPALIMSLRDKVTANLLQNYNCVILSRSNGFSISGENQLSIFNNLESDNTLPILTAADYSLIGYFKIVRRTPGEKMSVDLGCTMLIINLKDKKSFKKIEFIPDEMSLYDKDVTKEIVKILGLKAKEKEKRKYDGQIDETWAVLPIKRLESNQSIRKPADKELAMILELNLQQTGKLKEIVDHNEIDKVLTELKIQSINSSTENSAASIARILGADKLIMGSVTKVHKKKSDLRINLFLVDGRKSIIIDSISGITPPEKLYEKAAELVINFTKYKPLEVELAPADQELLDKEALIYQEVLKSLPGQWMKEKSEHTILLAEAIFLLKEKNHKSIYELGGYIVQKILRSDVAVSYTGKLFNKKDRKKLVKLIDKLLRRIEYTKTTPLPLLLRAGAFLQIDDISQAETLINQHLQEHPTVNPYYTNALLAYVAYKKKSYKITLELLKNTKRNYLGRYLKAWTYVKLDDSQYDEKELKNLKGLKIGKYCHYTLFVARRIRLQHKLEGSKSAFHFIQRQMKGYLKPHPEIQFEMAKLHYSKGETNIAAAIIEGINDPQVLAKSKYKFLENKKWLNLLKKEVSNFANKVGPGNNQWWKLKDIRDFSSYKIYIQPIGTPSMKILNMATKKIENFLGCKVELLPKLPLPEDNYCFFKERGQYESTHVWERCKVAKKLPEDAILLVNVSDKDMFRGNYNYIYVWWKYRSGEKSITYHKWWSYNDHLIADMIAKAVLGSLNIQIQRNVCPLKSCLFSIYSSSAEIKDKKFAICDKCKEKYEKIDLDFAKKDFHKKYNNPVLFNLINKKEDQDIFNKIVKNILFSTEKNRKISPGTL